jgi:hypothetical protein
MIYTLMEFDRNRTRTEIPLSIVDDASRHLDALRTRVMPAVVTLYRAGHDRYWAAKHEVEVPRAICLAELDRKLRGLVWC